MKQVNALIDHRDKRENQILNGGGRSNEFHVAKRKAQMQNRSKSTFIGNGSAEALMEADRQKMIEETKNIMEDAGGEDASDMDRRREQELKAVNEGYLNSKEPPESKNVTNMLKQGVKTKNGAPSIEREFQPFKSPFTEEIINTSKEVAEGESQKDQASHISSQR